MLVCPGGPILEIPEKGKWIFERLSPGTIREEDYYEEFRIVPGGGGTRLLVACPRGQTDRRGKCKTGQRVLRIWHSKKGLKRLVNECKSGKLATKRASALKRIEKDIERLRQRALGDTRPVAGRALFTEAAETSLGRIGQFLLSAVVGGMISIAVIKLFFPHFFGEEKKAEPPEPARPPVPTPGGTTGLGRYNYSNRGYF